MKAGYVIAALGICGAAALAKAAPGASAPASSQLAAGGHVFARWCAECHNARGFGTVSLERRYHGAVPAMLAQRADLTGDLIHYAVRNGVSFMPPFRKTEITAADLDALSIWLTTPPLQRPPAR